jgi:hypothetical protein
MRRHRPGHHRAGADHRVLADIELGENRRSGSDDGPAADADLTGKHRGGPDRNELRQFHVVTDAGTAVDECERADLRCPADVRHAVDVAAGRERRGRGNDRSRVDDDGRAGEAAARSIFARRAPMARGEQRNDELMRQ